MPRTAGVGGVSAVRRVQDWSFFFGGRADVVDSRKRLDVPRVDYRQAEQGLGFARCPTDIYVFCQQWTINHIEMASELEILFGIVTRRQSR